MPDNINTAEGNRSIALFFSDAAQYSIDGTFVFDMYWDWEDMMFHSSWDWQVPVMAKCMEEFRKILLASRDTHRDFINWITNEWANATLNNNHSHGWQMIITSIEAINQYNQQNKQL
jgi:hypothetical protein